MKHRYYLVGWTPNDSTVLKTLLHLMENSLQNQWDESPSVMEAALLLVDVSTPNGMQVYLQLAEQYPEKWVLPYGSNLSGYSLYLNKPVRSQGDAGLFSVFNNLRPLNPTSHTPHNTPVLPIANQGGGKNSRLYPIWNALTEGRSFALHFASDEDPGTPSFIVDAQSQHCYALERPNTWLNRFEGSVEGLGLPHSTIEKILKKAAYHTYPLSSMRWCLALLLWDGEKSSQVTKMQHFRLQRWPDFALLPYKPQHIVISGCLSKRSMTIDGIATTIKQPRELVQNFLNACAANGLLMDEKETAAAAVPVTASASTSAPIPTPMPSATVSPPMAIPVPPYSPQPIAVRPSTASETPAAASCDTAQPPKKNDLFAALLRKLKGDRAWVKPA